jgi:DNA polymerase-3 subunit beta
LIVFPVFAENSVIFCFFQGFIMKVQFNRAALAEALGLLTSVIPARTPKPILRCLKMTAEKKLVRLCATDLEVGINYSIDQVNVDVDGEVVVPADRLAAIVRESIDEVLTFKASEGLCEITGADSHFTVYGQETSQYPAVPGFDDKADIQITLENLQAAIVQCIFATAKESTRYALNGVLWQVKQKKLSMVATDGRRLVKTKASLTEAPKAEKASQLPQIIVPAKTLGLLEKISRTDGDVVSVAIKGNQILISCGNIVISSNLVEGTFPKYEDIIPTDYDKKITLNAEAVLSAVRRSALLTSEESRGIKLTLSKNLLVFSGSSPEAGDARVDMNVDYSGESIEIGFNPQYLTDMLRVIPEQQFELHLGSADRPGLIKSGKDFLYVLMPINLG